MKVTVFVDQKEAYRRGFDNPEPMASVELDRNELSEEQCHELSYHIEPGGIPTAYLTVENHGLQKSIEIYADSPEKNDVIKTIDKFIKIRLKTIQKNINIPTKDFILHTDEGIPYMKLIAYKNDPLFADKLKEIENAIKDEKTEIKIRIDKLYEDIMSSKDLSKFTQKYMRSNYNGIVIKHDVDKDIRLGSFYFDRNKNEVVNLYDYVKDYNKKKKDEIIEENRKKKEEKENRKKEFILNHGSKKLKMAYERGYPCSTEYSLEKAEYLFTHLDPNIKLVFGSIYYIDDDGYKQEIETQERTCPSYEAMRTEDILKGQLPDGEITYNGIVWVPSQDDGEEKISITIEGNEFLVNPFKSHEIERYEF